MLCNILQFCTYGEEEMMRNASCFVMVRDGLKLLDDGGDIAKSQGRGW